mmetsp:Transcript_37153/g.90079  ORF Transcript_37153/g.90079 Transcript_37153/m.90079 type:complete len:559 (-) Transcript_37153:1086-2762(-)
MTQTLLKSSSSCEAEEEEMGESVNLNDNIEKAMNDDTVDTVNDDHDDDNDGGDGDSDNGSSDDSDDDNDSVSSDSSDDDDSDDSDRANLSVRFHDDLTTEVHEIPSYGKDLIPDLFYTKDDYARFQSKEQKRYDKRMMKQVQQMVRDAMKNEILEAEERGATPEEIDAMMPQTPEAICELLGSITPATPTTPNGASTASIIPSCPLFSPPFPVPSQVPAEGGDGGGEGRDGDDVRTPASAPAADHPDGQEDGEGPKAEKTPSSSSPSSLSLSSPSKQRSKVVTERDRIVDNLSEDDLLQFMLGDDDKDNDTGDYDNDHNGDTRDNDGDTPLNVTVDKDKENNNNQDDENNSKQTDQREKPVVLDNNTNGDDHLQQQQEALTAPAEEGQEERTGEDSSSGNSVTIVKARIQKSSQEKSSHEEVSPSIEEEEGGVVAGCYSDKNIVTHGNVNTTPVAAATNTVGDDGGDSDGDSLFRRVSIFSDEDFTLNELIHEVPKGADFTHINKNQQLNDLLGTDFSTDVHVDDLVPRSPKNSPKTSSSSRKVHPLPPVPVDLLVRD